ncbi:MAG: hypothetical protein IPO48_02010 [Saprospiraceae bacterium]|nr:hypothetical protein [Saprospiraceae bacterium]
MGISFFQDSKNFIDETYTTDPLLSYKLFSYLPSNKVLVLAKYLNPILMTLLLVLFTTFVFYLNFLSEIDFCLLVILIGCNPQYFYAQNARLYGLSSRGLGLLLGTGILISLYFTTYIDIKFIILTIFLIYLAWITNLFLQQFLIVISLLMMIVFGEYLLFVSLVLSLVIFFIFKNDIALSFFKNRWYYFKIYKNILSERFILKYRYSIWRDWIYDFWIKKKYSSFPNWLSYVYNNSIFIVLFINPVIIVILIENFPKLVEFHTPNPFIKYCYYLSVSSILAFIIISFRSTRFLGEPERYIEMVIPFFTVLIFYNKNDFLVKYLPIIFILMCVFQILIFLKMKNELYPSENMDTIMKIVDVIKLMEGERNKSYIK